MTPKILYRSASVLLLLFAIGHTLGFRQIDPKWGIDATIRSMQTIQFQAQGATRTYWDFYMGFGLFVSVFLLFTALLAWQLGSLPAATLAQLRLTRWALAICFAGVLFLSWKYFFPAPVIFSALLLLILTAAANLPINRGQ